VTAPYRVLVTGSRDWDDEGAIAKPLTNLLAATAFVGDTLVLVHGACPRGADAMANAWAEWHRSRGAHIEIERHPADWEQHGKRAGFIRNQAMVDLGAAACFAFIRNGSRGATHTAQRAEAASIPTRRWTA
jgi:hypothetical protein